jgi:hypothetical protein
MKSKKARYVELNDAAIAWLDLFRGTFKDSDNIAPYSEESIFNRIANLRRDHLSFKWPQNAPRHSYASHIYVLKGEVYTKKQLGHSFNSEELFNYYRAAVTDDQAKRYFKIRPKKSKKLTKGEKKKDDENVVPFPKAS